VIDLKVKRVKYPIHPAGEDATAFIAALPILKAAQLIILV